MQLKDLFNEESVGALAAAVAKVYSAFDRKAFTTRVFDEAWEGRELKERMRHISTVLGGNLPSEYRTALGILQGALSRLDDHGFVKMVFPGYVEMHGLDDWEASMLALEEFTQKVSAEFAIRPFIMRYPERTMVRMFQWAKHEHPEVRRLASEGCRPRLPWGIRLSNLQADPSPILPILEQLKHDESESVRKSVANNLNDISKDHADVVLDLLRRWQADATDEVHWITSHALRTLLKQGDPEALELLGYPSEPMIAVHHVTVEPEVVTVGGEVTISFKVQSLSDRPQKLMIDYVVYSMKASGKLSPKVWKLTKRTIQPDEILRVSKRHSFAPVTTRKYYPGEHAIQPKINGKVFRRVGFVLS
jgi:3-methyladenine DNA glycosylase AlkC